MVAFFFREVEVIGRHRLVQSGPVVTVANHINGLVDPLLLWALLPRPPHMLGKSTLWDLPHLAWLLDLAGVLPAYRRIDGEDTGRNEETLDACRQALAKGEVVALFPEGISHDEPELQPLRTGAARIVLGAEERFGPLAVRLQPVGILFDDKYSFRSRVLLVVGESMPAVRPGEEPSTAAEVVYGLNQRLDDSLRDLTLNYPTWRTAARFRQAASVLEDEGPARQKLMALTAGLLEADHYSDDDDLKERFALERALDDLYPRLLEQTPKETEAVVSALDDYSEALDEHGLSHDVVTARYRLLASARWILQNLLILGVLFPVAIVGLLFNLLPYPLPAAVARRSGDHHLAATYKIYSSLVVFPLFWSLEAALLAWWWKNPWLFPVFFLVALASGWVALRAWERSRELWRRVRAFVLLRLGSSRREVRAAYRRLEACLAELVDRY